MTTAVIVQNRSATRHVPALGMKCDDREIPAPLKGPPLTECWLGMGGFIGTAELLSEDGSLGPGQEIQLMSTMTLAVDGSRLIGIVSPDQATAPAVWVAVSLSDLEIKTEGKVGFFRRRPLRIEIQGPDDLEIIIGRVERLYLKTKVLAYGGEDSLVEALGA